MSTNLIYMDSVKPYDNEHRCCIAYKLAHIQLYKPAQVYLSETM